MRIVQVVPSMESGKLAQEALEFAQEMARQGHESSVISSGGALVSRLTLHNCQHFELPVHRKGLVNNRLHRKVRKQLESMQADVLLCRDSLCSWHGWKIWQSLPEAARPRLITFLHRWPQGGIFGRGWMKGAVARGELVFAASQDLARRLSKRFEIPLAAPEDSPKPFTVRHLYRGVNVRELDRRAPVSGHWQQRLLNNYPQLEGRSWLLLPGEIGPGRGQDNFLELLAELKKEREDLFGLVVGEVVPGQEKFARGLEQRAESMGLAEHVVFLGPRRDMRELYASARITFELADPLYADGRVISEALAMGCPAVTLGGPGVEVLQQCFPQGLNECVAVGSENVTESGDLNKYLVATCLTILREPEAIDFSGFSLEETGARAVDWFQQVNKTS
ncbi:glycosyltransferase [Microbulbifer agarilyticus]